MDNPVVDSAPAYSNSDFQVIVILTVVGDSKYYRAAEMTARSLLEKTSFHIAISCDDPQKLRIKYPGRISTHKLEVYLPALRPAPFIAKFQSAINVLNDKSVSHAILMDVDCLLVDDISEADILSVLGDSEFAMVEQTGIRDSNMSRASFLDHFRRVAVPVIDPDSSSPNLETFRYWNSGVVIAKSSALLELSRFALLNWERNPSAHIRGDHMVADQDYFQYWGSIRNPGSIKTISSDWNHCYWWDLDFPRDGARVHHYSNFCLGPDESTLQKMASASQISGLTTAIISHNSEKFLEKTICEQRARNLGDVMVWDNGSTDNSVEIALGAGAKVIASHENIGFARAANALVALAPSKTVLLLNPDVELDDETLSRALIRIDSKGVVAVAPAQRWPNELLVPALQAGYTRRRLIAEILFPQVNILGIDNLLEKFLGVGKAQWSWASGACLFVDKDRFLEIGGFDEQFFLYMEDVAFGKKSAEANYLMLETGTTVYHSISSGSEISSILRTSLLTQARILFAKRYFGGMTAIFASIIGRLKGIR